MEYCLRLKKGIEKDGFPHSIVYNTEYSNSIILNINSADESCIQIIIIDMAGKKCFSKESYHANNAVAKQLDFDSPFACGM